MYLLDGTLDGCHFKLGFKMDPRSVLIEVTYGSTPSQCASACLMSAYGECSGFSFHPLSEDHEKCKLYSESVFTKNDTETAAVGWCPKGGSTFYHVCSKEFCFQILLQAIVSLRQI